MKLHTIFAEAGSAARARLKSQLNLRPNHSDTRLHAHRTDSTGTVPPYHRTTSAHKPPPHSAARSTRRTPGRRASSRIRCARQRQDRLLLKLAEAHTLEPGGQRQRGERALARRQPVDGARALPLDERPRCAVPAAQPAGRRDERRSRGRAPRVAPFTASSSAPIASRNSVRLSDFTSSRARLFT